MKMLSIRKWVSVFLCMLLLAGMLTACGTQAQESEEAADAMQPTEAVTVNVTALKGPTAMGMVQMMNQADDGEFSDAEYRFNIAASIDEVTPALIKGETDIAAVPANVASVLYNRTEGGIEVLAINTLGVLYIVESGDSVHSVEDLRGRTIYASGKGATPEYALDYILSENGIDPISDVTIEWKSEHTECLTALLADEDAIALLPQPFVTTAQTKSESIRVALDLTKEWDAIQEGSEQPSAMLTGVLVARRDFVEQNPEAVRTFLQRYQASVEQVNADNEMAAKLIGAYDIVPETVAIKALPACNIVYIDGVEMQQKLSGYLAVLFEQNPESVGGELPLDDFYYAG